MSMLLDIFGALLALGMAAAWVLTGGGGDKLPRKGSTDKIA